MNRHLTVILFILSTFGLNFQAASILAVQLRELSASTHSLNGANSDGQKKKLLIRLKRKKMKVKDCGGGGGGGGEHTEELH